MRPYVFYILEIKNHISIKRSLWALYEWPAEFSAVACHWSIIPTLHSFISNLSEDRSTASSKTIPPLNAI
jgi:hypothetical protein